MISYTVQTFKYFSLRLHNMGRYSSTSGQLRFLDYRKIKVAVARTYPVACGGVCSRHRSKFR